MIEDSKKRDFDFILVWKLDRFSRDRYDSAIYKRELKKNGVRVLSVMENVGHGDESIILESILESMAEFYSRDLSKKVKRGLRETCLKGNFPGGYVPIGYQVVGQKIQLDPEIAPLIRRAFERFASGVSTRRIIDELNANGVRGNHGRPITYSTVNKILKNQKYIGEFIHGENRLTDAYEPLIDPETFERVKRVFPEINARRRPEKPKNPIGFAEKSSAVTAGPRWLVNPAAGSSEMSIITTPAPKRKSAARAGRKTSEKIFWNGTSLNRRPNTS